MGRTHERERVGGSQRSEGHGYYLVTSYQLEFRVAKVPT
jgi:hypothetical protein